MKDINLQFKDEKHYLDVVVDSGWLKTNYGNVFIDEIGFIPVVDDPKSKTPAIIGKEGYYINIRIVGDNIDLSDIEQFIIKNPDVRKWA
ncbi:hypothetical protein ESCO40_00132 [Escherichia phage vB_EcoS_ESCO40]|uniref:Uncharacterized protein n=1 Tax=Escherichia phage vB_EcoS_ESCO40 TaxID=2918880 RepID=A0AAE9KW86_9CAUD|nr:hypothetical protein ESCO40_00132 [Escherichia phage vB_EcoS_ESCO40]